MACDLCVGGEKRDALDENLRDQEAIERILMQRRQRSDIYGVLAGEGQLGVTIVEKSAAQKARLDTKILSAEGVLDCNLPQTGGADSIA